jgi:arginyl-tRNA synthetase
MAHIDLGTLPSVSGTNPELAVIDAFRIAIAVALTKILGLDLEAAYAGIDTTKKLTNAQFLVPIPRFRLPGNPTELAKKVAEEVICLSRQFSANL